jgi:hypothetical protein
VPAVGGGATPTGTILINDGSTTIATGTLSGGTFTFTTAALLGGSRSLTAVYNGDANYLGDTSDALTQTVAQKTATPALARSASSSSSAYGSNVIFTATLTPAASFTGSGTIGVAAGAFTDAAGNPSTAGTVSPLLARPWRLTVARPWRLPVWPRPWMVRAAAWRPGWWW